MNITATYFQHMNQHPERLAIVTDDEEVNYRDWYKLVSQTAASFMNEEFLTKRVAIFLPNERLFLQIFAGASMAGWASIVGDLRWKKTEITERMEQVTPDLIIADSKMRSIFDSLSYPVLYSNELDSWLIKEEHVEVNVAENLPFYIGFTSGSTGKPKAFVRSQQSWVESFPCDQKDLSLGFDEHVLIPGSFTSSTFVYGAMSTFYDGGTVYLLKKFSPRKVAHVINNRPISICYVVPTMIQALLHSEADLERPVTFISTGAKLLPNVKRQFRKNYPKIQLHEFYGASELSYVSVIKHGLGEKYDASVGKPFHNVEVRIIKPDGEEAEIGEEGILHIKSKMVFDEYINNPTETEKVKQDGWVTVHDIAKMDEEGYIYILGRENDMILYGGYNIYPQEIEKVIVGFPGVEEVCVTGIPDEYWGEKPVAFIKGDVDLRLLRTYCREKLSSYKVPRIWEKVSSLPKTSAGKVAKQQLKALLDKGSYV